MISKQLLSHEILFGIRRGAGRRAGLHQGTLKTPTNILFLHRFFACRERRSSLGKRRHGRDLFRRVSSLSPMGFTLVELLVVIGILAVLAALLLPAISAATGKANLVKCASNLRQITAATLLSANDNNGMYPALEVNPFDPNCRIERDFDNRSSFSPASIHWGVALAPYLGFEPVNLVQTSPEQIPAIFKCPAAARNGAENLAAPWISTMPSYRYNGYAAGRTAASALTVSRAMLWIDAVWPDWPKGTFAHQNPAGINVAYLDGHVAFMPYSDYTNVNRSYDYQDDLYQLGWFK